MNPLGAVWPCAVSQSLSCIPRALRAVSKSFVSQSLERALSSETGSQDPCSARHAVTAWQHFMLLWSGHKLF